MQEILKEQIFRALKALGIEDVEPTIEYPADLSYGDFATNVAMVAAKQAGANPKALAEKIVAELGKIENVEKIEVATPGFINFTLARGYYSQVLKNMRIDWGKNQNLKGKRVIVEYSQPNPFKPFHIGHLMSTAIGESISRLVEFSGANIFRANYGGDVGPHVAKSLWGIAKHGLDPSSIEDLGKAYVLGNSAYEENPEAKSEIETINKKIYANDPSLKEAYDAGRETSIKHFEELYDILGTHFDLSFYESETAPIGIPLVTEGLKKGIFEESDGAIVYKGEKVGLHTRVFLTSKGTPTYEAKEIGFVALKSQTFPFDLNITTVAVEQDNYFKVVEAAIAELMPEMAGKYTHVAFGMMQLSSGKMSSRKGNVVTGESLIEEMREKALLKMKGRDLEGKEKEVADMVAVAAIKYSVLKQSRGKNIIFDPEASLSFEGDSGPYLQYSYVRARSVLQKASTFNLQPSTSVPELIPVFERLLPRFPAVVERAAREYEPHYVTTYLTELAGAFNSWYATEKIIGSEHETYKLALTRAFATTMKNGLWLLGIKAPEKM